MHFFLLQAHEIKSAVPKSMQNRSKWRVLLKPLPLRRVLRSQRVFDVVVCDRCDFLHERNVELAFVTLTEVMLRNDFIVVIQNGVQSDRGYLHFGKHNAARPAQKP